MTAPVLILAGPTASGKSDAGLALARRVGGEVVNADSMQVYAALPTLTARPQVPPDVPHHLYGHVDAHARYSVGRYLGEARSVIASVRGRGHAPILVGGTGLYLRVVTEGLSAVPEVSAGAERVAAARYDADPAAARAALLTEDPEAARLEPGDRQRHVRRMAVLAATGRPLPAWQADRLGAVPGPVRACVLCPPREALYARIDARAAEVFGEATEEVRALMTDGLPEGPLGRALGVAPIAAMLRGALGRDEALARMRTDTRRYAKRQMTWLRNQTDWPWFETGEAAARYLSDGATVSSA